MITLNPPIPDSEIQDMKKKALFELINKQREHVMGVVAKKHSVEYTQRQAREAFTVIEQSITDYLEEINVT